MLRLDYSMIKLDRSMLRLGSSMIKLEHSMLRLNSSMLRLGYSMLKLIRREKSQKKGANTVVNLCDSLPDASGNVIKVEESR